MNADEKAKDIWFTLFTKQIDVTGSGDGDLCVEIALVVVDEIIKAGKDVDQFPDSYWQEVKKRIKIM